ncbi:Rieske (2Fe-2S) iron-sulfur domain protein [Deinococcus proteolyticus MRP]|uniref:Rieske (2Fe-2S) iron-sulfur domain protein n=1 Tax=Deinococcus proteolyticus (strain ATCC 35074 / DSM 20540 / JCM 6276 / NBRC 101906 / NCIMB 13154 / VKM Ac-1939 / CCM 2703 / MRP) TaxID=693977 RepID=F0RMJ5_DEIPM|nr:Rieske 2Fe-2S domain-containing protein [Deinococcus proteolyticus]ADY26045.1 Rieske (2Fe-2S) iron-sulfur domain protein [Deinococcus proteolyticus MRP]
MTDPGSPQRAQSGYRRLSRRSLLSYWWTLPVAGTLGTFGWLGLRAGRILTRKEKPGEPEYVPGAVQAIAPLADFPTEWHSLEFSYQGDLTIVLRLPQPVLGGISVGEQHFAAFSRRCTHQGCPVVMVRDQEVLALAYNYRAEDAKHPQLGCPCHYSVFDPLKAGEAVFGQATLPLPRIALEVRGEQLYAVGREEG